ncbi:MAG: UDP-N-acetylmuramoyl-L-alanyl-D-glutamate--2,6-diaminopimelate ligase, partial [Ruminococcus sp.]|nr:UDP-N-acetylmuramoyl-L-alanyl-D-glutamate--2,6-diaminopimelate ligase [Candidatus Apopatosoma intestinale]
SVYNSLAAAALCHLVGISPDQFAKTVSSVTIPGRFEYDGDPGSDPVFILDYAHTGDSLRSLLSSVYEYRPARILCVFGSVGGRTELRRKELGEAAQKYADFSVITSDNPDREDPLRIAHDIVVSMEPDKYTVIPDREQAIRFTVGMARPGDVVLFAGKGHESYQLIDGNKIPFSEKEIILKATAEKSYV